MQRPYEVAHRRLNFLPESIGESMSSCRTLIKPTPLLSRHGLHGHIFNVNEERNTRARWCNLPLEKNSQKRTDMVIDGIREGSIGRKMPILMVNASLQLLPPNTIHNTHHPTQPLLLHEISHTFVAILLVHIALKMNKCDLTLCKHQYNLS